MKLIPVTESVGMVLGHDITAIVPGLFKGPAFKRGHVIRPEDVDRLRGLGKQNIVASVLGSGWVHEDDAAHRLATAAAGACIFLSAPCEGKVSLVAESDGLLKKDCGSIRTRCQGKDRCSRQPCASANLRTG